MSFCFSPHRTIPAPAPAPLVCADLKASSASSPSSCQVPAASCQVPAASCQLPGASCQVPAARCQLPGARCQLPGASCQVPAARCQLPAAECHILTAQMVRAKRVTYEPGLISTPRLAALPPCHSSVDPDHSHWCRQCWEKRRRRAPETSKTKVP